jgi:hypothetical protein
MKRMTMIMAALVGMLAEMGTAQTSITASTNLVESQVNLYNGVPVIVSGSGVILTLSNSATYGNLPVYQFGNLIVTNGASVVGLSQGGMSPYTIPNAGVAIQSAGDVIVAGGSSINADGTGFLVAQGPGGTTGSAQGGTHGGHGEGNAKATYGSYTNPTTLGSGGGDSTGGNGGGAIKLIVAGNLAVNGRLSANGSGGTGYDRGGGAGGSLWITGGGTLGGTGEVQVSGGMGHQDIGHGGGGGRLAMDDTVTSYNFQGNIRGAAGNQNSLYGSAGTVYFPASAAANFTVYSNQTVVVGNDVTNVFGNLTVYGTLIPAGYCAGFGTGVVIQAANITIAPSGAISADGWGFAASWGPAPSGGYTSTNGACHGGRGSYPLYATYGSATQPNSMGSGGSGHANSAAGGAIKLVVAGTLTVNGGLSARGLPGGSSDPGAAGGSVWIACGTLTGTNVIDASAGSSSTYGYGSGGGRIAIYYNTNTFSGLPATGLYTNLESISSKVIVKGGYHVGSDGPEDGSIYVYNMILPAIDNAGGATNVTTSSAWLNGTLTSTGGAPTTVYVFWGTTDGSNNLAAWANTNTVAFSNLGPLTQYVASLTQGTAYYYTYYATNSYGQTWASPSKTLITPAPPAVNNNGGATSVLTTQATLNGILTGGGSAHIWIYWGTNSVAPENPIDLGTWAQGVAFSTNVTGLTPLTTYYYCCFASNSINTATSPVTNFTTTNTFLSGATLGTAAATTYSNIDVIVSGCTLTLNSSTNYGSLATYFFRNLTVTNGASVVCLAQSNMTPYTITNAGVAIQVAGDVIVAGGSSINADGTGFLASFGPGASASGSQGGTHGGHGEGNTKVTYGSYTNPTTLGSGGGDSGSTGNGGGAIKLIVAGNLVVNGRLSANGSAGTSYMRGGGAGGSLWITGGGTLGGTGEVQVSGGSGQTIGQGGGGGRLAMADTVTYNFQGNIRGELGNENSGYGGAGTVYFPASAAANFTVYSNQTVVVGNDVTNVFGSLTVYGTLIPGGTYAGLGTGVVISAANITIAPSGAISADGWGFGVGLGPAPANANAGINCTNGASHGGWGSYPLGAPYGSATQPNSMGSGGGSYGSPAAGGAVKLVVAGTLTVNGGLSARGLSSGGNGICPYGAGGSVWIDCGTLAGTNVIDASAGGSSTYGSGGGRIAIYYKSSAFSGLPAPGLYINKESISSKVLVKGGYNIGADGPEDGSIYIVHVVPMGTAVWFY